MDNEPDVLKTREQIMAELRMTKDEREADQKAKDEQRGSLFNTIYEVICRTSPARSFAWRRWRVAVFTEGMPFKLTFISLVCINGVLIGVQADYDKGQSFWGLIEVSFNAAFILELALKYFGFGWYFWTDAWNVADFIIVVISVVQMVLDAGAGLAAFRMLRVFRVIRSLAPVAVTHTN